MNPITARITPRSPRVAIIGAIGGFYLFYKGYKEKNNRWINWIMALITIGWELYVWFLLNGLRNIS
jgi:hypothetical protein